MAITPNTAFTAGQILTAAQQNNFPRGLMNKVGVTSNVTLTTTVSDITTAISFTAETGRQYKASWVVSGLKNTSNGYIEVAFTTSANVQIQAIDTTAVSGGYFNLSGMALLEATSGSVSYKLRGVVENDTATITGTATVPIVLVIEDIGHV